jgi:hypothetical protein
LAPGGELVSQELAELADLGAHRLQRLRPAIVDQFMQRARGHSEINLADTY